MCPGANNYDPNFISGVIEQFIHSLLNAGFSIIMAIFVFTMMLYIFLMLYHYHKWKRNH